MNGSSHGRKQYISSIPSLSSAEEIKRFRKSLSGAVEGRGSSLGTNQPSTSSTLSATSSRVKSVQDDSQANWSEKESSRQHKVQNVNTKETGEQLHAGSPTSPRGRKNSNGTRKADSQSATSSSNFVPSDQQPPTQREKAMKTEEEYYDSKASAVSHSSHGGNDNDTSDKNQSLGAYGKRDRDDISYQDTMHAQASNENGAVSTQSSLVIQQSSVNQETGTAPSQHTKRRKIDEKLKGEVNSIAATDDEKGDLISCMKRLEASTIDADLLHFYGQLLERVQRMRSDEKAGMGSFPHLEARRHAYLDLLRSRREHCNKRLFNVYHAQKVHGAYPEQVPGSRKNLESLISEFQKEEFATARKMKEWQELLDSMDRIAPDNDTGSSNKDQPTRTPAPVRTPSGNHIANLKTDTMDYPSIRDVERLGHPVMHDYYTQLKRKNQSHSADSLLLENDLRRVSSGDTYCFCRSAPTDEMLLCGNSGCKSGQWFHKECVRQRTDTSLPLSGTVWYCPVCQSLPEFKSPQTCTSHAQSAASTPAVNMKFSDTFYTTNTQNR